MIRPGERTDISLIDAFDEFAGDRAQEIADGRLLVYCAKEVVAYISAASFVFHRCPYIEFLCVQKDFRRRGVATALLSAMENRFRGQRLLISTESDNLPMLALLRGRGYQHAGDLIGLNRDGVAEVFFFKDVLR